MVDCSEMSDSGSTFKRFHPSVSIMHLSSITVSCGAEKAFLWRNGKAERILIIPSLLSILQLPLLRRLLNTFSVVSADLYVMTKIFLSYPGRREFNWTSFSFSRTVFLTLNM